MSDCSIKPIVLRMERKIRTSNSLFIKGVKSQNQPTVYCRTAPLTATPKTTPTLAAH